MTLTPINLGPASSKIKYGNKHHVGMSKIRHYCKLVNNRMRSLKESRDPRVEMVKEHIVNTYYSSGCKQAILSLSRR